MIVHGADGLDEITTTGATFVAELKHGGEIVTYELTPADAGLVTGAGTGIVPGSDAIDADAFSPLQQSTILYPLLIGAVGMLASILGALLVRGRPGRSLSAQLHFGTNVAMVITGLAAIGVAYWVFGADVEEVTNPLFLGLTIIIGLVAGYAIGFTSEYYTSDHYSPVKKLAGQSDLAERRQVAGQRVQAGMRRGGVLDLGRRFQRDLFFAAPKSENVAVLLPGLPAEFPEAVEYRKHPVRLVVVHRPPVPFVAQEALVLDADALVTGCRASVLEVCDEIASTRYARHDRSFSPAPGRGARAIPSAIRRARRHGADRDLRRAAAPSPASSPAGCDVARAAPAAACR